MMKKAEKFKSTILENSEKQKVPPALVYAIMHSESSFNPMARSHIPAFGLMQIVPKSAGIDAYQYLYKKKRVLTSDYLYNSDKNINIGSAYLHILYYRYLRKIKDPQSKLYCTIAAYNTGAGNVAKAFIGSRNISKASVKINSISSDEVYQKLLKDLPYDETKNYLKKVTKRISSYKKFLSKK
ncbi:MAG: transglycosylase SLT domain-containing protein, partial [Campylobacterota bacterium]|nr:transglycosylase SLT domain-containing protein [Campylobacterota bacterium]